MWDKRYGELVAFKKRFGHCHVPQHWQENPSLGKWVRNQRVHYRDHTISKEQQYLLNELDFTWDPFIAKWEQRYEELIEFKNKYHHCNVPMSWKNYSELSAWVSRQRQLYKQTKLSKRRTLQLENLGFTWDLNQAKWEQHYQEFKAFKKQFGHCNVPKKWEENKSLSIWVSIQRTKYDKNQLSTLRKQLLSSVGFDGKLKK